jgi:hypothetical protein
LHFSCRKEGDKLRLRPSLRQGLSRGAEHTALFTQRFRRRVFAVLRVEDFVFLACRDAHGFDGIADDVGGALLGSS